MLTLAEATRPAGGRQKPISVVEMGELKVSANAQEVLASYSIGSGLCVAISDLETHVGGLLHFLLPDSETDPDRRATQPAVFGDTGMQRLLEMMVEHQAMRKRLRVYLIGGADPRGDVAELGALGLGKRNRLRAEEQLAGAGLRVTAAHCGGTAFRTVLLDVDSGAVTVRSPLQEEVRL